MHFSGTRDHGLAQVDHITKGMRGINLQCRWIVEEFTAKNNLMDSLPTPMASAQARHSKLSEILDVSRYDADASSKPKGETMGAVKAEVDATSPTHGETRGVVKAEVDPSSPTEGGVVDYIKEEDDASSPAQGADGNANTSVDPGCASNAFTPNDTLFSDPYGVGDGALYLANE